MLATLDDLASGLRTIKLSAFRLETLSHYAAPGEADLLRRYLDGLPMPPRDPQSEPWLGMVADSVNAGRDWCRVHILSRPLSAYLQFELLGYQGNVLAGEDVRIAERRAATGEMDTLGPDFWLLDDETVFVMNYDTTGRLVEMVETTGDVATFLAQRDLAVRLSIPLADFMADAQADFARSW
jgi:uncharacterized protein DUF6879